MAPVLLLWYFMFGGHNFFIAFQFGKKKKRKSLRHIKQSQRSKCDLVYPNMEQTKLEMPGGWHTNNKTLQPIRSDESQMCALNR